MLYYFSFDIFNVLNCIYIATLLSNFIFDGARADLTKGISLNPAFQVTHSFSLGSQVAPPNYSFGAVYADSKVNIFKLKILFF